MIGPRLVRQGWGLAALCGSFLPSWSPAQGPASPVRQPAAAVAAPAPGALLHEAIRSAPEDVPPVFVEKAPPAAIAEGPGAAPPGKDAVSLSGYWIWNPDLKDYAWVAGIWRTPPTGRFWAHGYWRREPRGWYRVPGFWSDRPVDRIGWRKEAPPFEHPADEPGPPPGEDRFYIPGHYVPEGDGLTWKKGFWTKVQPGWVWEPARWVRQPEGWAVREGFWDRPLEDRWARFAGVNPAVVPEPVERADRPRSRAYLAPTVQVYGGFIRPSMMLDRSPGRDSDPSGRFQGIAGPGTFSSFGGRAGNPDSGMGGYSGPSPMINNNNPGFASSVSAGSGFGGYPYYGHGLGTSPGYYGGSNYGSGIGYYPGYYGGSGAQSGQQGIQQGGLGGYPYYGHGLGYYPGYFGP